MKFRKFTDLIVVHCSATKPHMDVGAAELRQWHLDRGWSDIGYHYVIRRSGRVEPGRALGAAGAHAQGYNDRSVGICLVGGIDDAGDPDANYTRAQYAALESLIRDLHARAMKDPTWTSPPAVLGHRDLAGVQKECPCFCVRCWWMNR